MLNYQTAKELKDAGFPNIQDVQHRQGREFITPDGRQCVYSLGDLAPTADWFVPTLSELVEACAVRNGFTLQNVSANEWRARDDLSEWHHGPTATEAAARLWLAQKAQLVDG